jgi:probable DNA metabolism protein
MKLKDLIYLAKRNRKFDSRIWQKALKQDPELTRCFATPESKKLYRMHSAVSTSLCKAKGFTRLEKSHDTLYGYACSEHNILDLLLKHFHKRFPRYTIALEHHKKTHTIDEQGKIRIHTARLRHYLKNMGFTPENTDNTDDKIYTTYYKSQNIKERRNIALMRKLMPKKHSKINHTEQMMLNSGTKLTDYI